MNKKIILKTISWILLISWMIIIFRFSAMDTNESNNRSENTINRVIETTIDTSNQIGITDNYPSEQQVQELVKKLNHPLRKCVHFIMYFVLALLIINLLIKYNINKINICIISLIICIIYASFDEYHQTFVMGRNGQITDVIIDVLGCSVGIIIYLLLFKIKDNIRQKTTK